MIKTARRISALLLLLAFPTTANAAPPWSDPVDVPNSDGAQGILRAAFGPSGRGLLTWSAGRGFLPPTRGSVVAADGTLAPGGQLSPTLAAFEIEIYGADRLIAVGVEGLGGQRSRPAFAVGTLDRGLGRARPLTSRRTFSFSAAVSSTGGAAVALQTCTARTRSACRPALDLIVRQPGRRFSRPVRLADPARGRGFSPAVAMNAGGDVLVAWKRGTEIHAQIRLASGRLLRPQRLARRALDSFLSASLSPSRHAVVAWDDQVRGEGPSSAPAALYAAARAGSRFGRARLLERFEPAGEIGESLGVDVEHTAADRAVLAWSGQDGNRRAVRVADVSGAAIGAAQTLSAPGTDAIAPDVAVGSSGDAVVLWQLPGPLDELARRATDLVAAARPAAAPAFGPAEEVLADTEIGGAALGVDAAGRLVVTWAPGIGRGGPLRASFRPPPAQ